MNIAKHLKDSNSQPLPKKRFQYWIKKHFATLMFSSLLGTYLDLFFVGKQFYMFPIRPFPSIFPINIAYTLIVLPIVMIAFLYLMEKWKTWKRVCLIFILSLLMSVLEKKAEAFDLFVHSNDWSHSNTLFGYVLFLGTVYMIDVWINKYDKTQDKTF